MRYILVLIFALQLTACTTSKVEGTKESIAVEAPKKSEPYVPPPLNMNELEFKLDMRRDKQDLGFVEKQFNPCSLRMRRSHCKNLFFSKLNFKVMCRASDGTVEYVSNYELKPLMASNVTWKLGYQGGVTRLDNGGHGSIRTISPRPFRGERFILVLGKKSLGLRAHSASRIIVPQAWCN